MRCYFLLLTFANTDKCCTNAYFDLSEWLRFFTVAPVTEAGWKPLRRKCSAAACSSGTLCTHIKTSLQECERGSAFKTGIYRHLWNSLVCRPTHTNTLPCICSYIVTHWEDISSPSPLYESLCFAMATENKWSTQLKLGDTSEQHVGILLLNWIGFDLTVHIHSYLKKKKKSLLAAP